LKRARKGDLTLKWCNWDILNGKHKERKELLRYIKEQNPETNIVVDDEFEYFDPAEACVWIDPLDGTSNFIKGNFDCVTTVIGLSIRGESRIGIVHNEYFDFNFDRS
jgi:fructose-1,6-bisphosphatase/inositol monophosphatase family enzyme